MKILFMTFYDPCHLGIRQLASFMKLHNHVVHILQIKNFKYKELSEIPTDVTSCYLTSNGYSLSSAGDTIFPVSDIENKLLCDFLSDWDPDIIGITNRSPFNHLIEKCIPIIKAASPSSFIINGGFGPTFNPEIFLRAGSDAVIRGEGEKPLLNLVEALMQNKNWKNIDGLSYIENGKVKNNPLEPLMNDLDQLPFSLYDSNHFSCIEDNEIRHGDMRKEFPISVFNSSYVILGGRGCIGHCSYCSGGNFRDMYKEYGFIAPPIRMRSIKNLKEELVYAKNTGEKYIYFADEYFVRPINELKEFLIFYRDHINIPFSLYLSHKQLSEMPELVDISRDAGLSGLTFGVQTGDESFAKKIYNRQNCNKDIIKVINYSLSRRMNVLLHFIGGNPLEDDNIFLNTLSFVKKCKFDPSYQSNISFNSFMLKLFPGTPLAQKYPHLLDSKSDPKKFFYRSLLIELAYIANDDILNSVMQDEDMREHPYKLAFLVKQFRRDMHYQYLFKEIERLEGREVYFWGCGDLYQYKHHLFQKTRPRCILVDKGDHPDTVNGLPVRHPDEVLLPEGEKLPIIMFTQTPNKICRTIARRYPEYTDTVACARL